MRAACLRTILLRPGGLLVPGATAAFLSASGSFGSEPFPWSPFGIGSCHVNNRSVEDNARWVPEMEAIGLKVYRSAQTGWGAVEPTEGNWSWKEIDRQWDYLAEHGFSFGGLLIGNPSWNTKDARGSLPVNHLEGWSRYVREIVDHSAGRVKWWEVWNEPPNFTGRDQTPADYAKIVVAAHDAAKSADPDCLVGLAAKSAHVNYLEQVILAGAKDHFDFITLHPYEVLDGVAENAGSETVFLNIVPALRRMLAARNPEKADVPVIFTELGVDSRKGADLQAAGLVKAYVLGLAQGVACIQWFEGRDGDSGPLGLIDREGKPRLAYHALGRLIEHLGQHPRYLGWVQFEQRHCGFLFEGAAGTVMVAWVRGGEEPGEIEMSSLFRILDTVSGELSHTAAHPLSPTPVLVLDVPDTLVEEAKRNRGKLLPWGGDYSDASSVSLTVENGRSVENGLHTRSGDSVADAVVAYGGSARAGNVPGGNLFIVDPGFLSYDRVPLEISVKVRRNEANENAGFKLVYESVDGFKTAGGWYTVPDNREWHTVTWRIEDPQFVNYWGYNFSLVSDGNTFNRYFLQSVTVKKLEN